MVVKKQLCETYTHTLSLNPYMYLHTDVYVVHSWNSYAHVHVDLTRCKYSIVWFTCI